MDNHCQVQDKGPSYPFAPNCPRASDEDPVQVGRPGEEGPSRTARAYLGLIRSNRPPSAVAAESFCEWFLPWLCAEVCICLQVYASTKGYACQVDMQMCIHTRIQGDDAAVCCSSCCAPFVLSNPRDPQSPSTQTWRFSGLLFRNLNQVTIVQKPCYLLYIHIMVT